MTTHEILTKARALIAEPERWTQGVLARDKDGEEIGSCSERAVCWCAVAAIYKVAGTEPMAYEPVFEALDSTHDCDSIADFNDTADHAEVLAAFDAAIEATKEAK